MLYIAFYLTLCFIDVNAEETFPKGFSKKDFHVTTLKEPNFSNDETPQPEKDEKEKEKANTEDCPDFSPEELKKMRMDYNSDGARIKFVSPDALTTDAEEIKKVECFKKLLAASEPSEKKMKASFDSPVKFENQTVGNKNDTKGRRGNEYEFDTVEYYDDDDGISFGNDLCPDLVDIINLELAEIRKYDLECERMCEWTSLNDFGMWG